MCAAPRTQEQQASTLWSENIDNLQSLAEAWQKHQVFCSRGKQQPPTPEEGNVLSVFFHPARPNGIADGFTLLVYNWVENLVRSL